MQYRKIKVKNTPQDAKSLLEKLLALKGFTLKKETDKFLNPKKEDFLSPYSFLDMERAIERIKSAIEKKEKILIWGDFDCDGVTSSAVLYKALNALGANLSVFIPDRLLHGHGFNTKELIKLVSKEKVKLVITVDCATGDTAQVKLLKGLGVDTIITDHHSTDTELPEAFAIINPQVKGALKEDLSVEDIQSLTYNSGSAIAYKLAVALLEDKHKDLEEELLVVASMGLIADVVPLKGENRAMVSCALKLLNEKQEKINKGIFRLLSKNLNGKEITSYDAAFILAPRINAVGRLSNAKLSFDFLTTDDDIKLDMIIEKLDNYNKIRQSKCTETYEEIIDYIKNNPSELKNPAIILINPDWHIGVIGIVASKIAEEFNKPCFLMTVDDTNTARCSIRSNNIVNVYQVLKENETLFVGFGGHRGAGGCSFSKDDFDKVKEALLKTSGELIDNKKEEDTLYADIALEASELNLDILDTINQLEPFGEGNEPPLFALFDVNLDEFKLIGKEANHLRVIFSKGDKKFSCVKWSEGEINIPLNSKCDVAFYPRLNVFNNEKNLQLEIVDIYSDSAAKKDNSIKLFDHRKKTGILASIASYLEGGVDIGIWAKNPHTKEELSKFSTIKNNFILEASPHKGLMLFDYPSSKQEFKDILLKIQPQKIHLMNHRIDENLENYIKQLVGMIKYCSNKLQGEIDILKIAQSLGVSESFVQISLEILETIGSINILDVDKIEYLKPFSYEEFKNCSMFEALEEDFNTTIEFKKELLSADIKEVEAIISK